MKGKQAKQDTGVVDIHGKSYKTVALRVTEFHQWNRDVAEGAFSIITSPVSIAETVVIFRCDIVHIETQKVVARGHSEEFRSSSHINRTSAVENAETSAIGRALACFGFGGTEFASANEVQGAIAQQQKISFHSLNEIKAYIKEGLINPDHLRQVFGEGKSNPSQLNQVEADRVINGLKAKLAAEKKAEAEAPEIVDTPENDTESKEDA